MKNTLKILLVLGLIFPLTTNAYTLNELIFGAGGNFIKSSTTPYIANLFTRNATTSSLYVGSLSGALTAVSGQVSATSLSNDQILVGNGTGFTTATANTANGWVKTDSSNNVTGYNWILQTSSTSDMQTQVPDEGELRVGTSTTFARLYMGDGHSANYIVNPLDFSSTTLNVNYSLGNFGIGSSTPSKALSVVGDAEIGRAGGSVPAGLTRTLGIRGGARIASVPYTNIDFLNNDNNDGAAEYTGARISTYNANGIDDGEFRFYTSSGAMTLNSTPSLTITGRTNPGNISFPYASTTMISATTASSTSLFATNATTTSLGVLNLSASNCDVKSTTGGSLYCGTDATGAGGGTFPFTPANYNGQTVNATSTGLWLTSSSLSLIASSTFSTLASTTVFSNSGATYLATDGVSNVGLGSTSPTKKLVVSGDTTLDRAGSTAANSLRTLEVAGTGRAAGQSFANLDFKNYDNNDGSVDYIGARISAINASGVDDGTIGIFSASAARTLNTTPSITVAGTSGVGRVGLSTTSPFGLLAIEQGTETKSLWVGNQGSSTPSLVVSGVNGNGNVGIGTVGAPTSALHVNLGGSSGVGLKITGASSGGTTDNVNGVVIGLDYNTSGNRQFSLADSETGIGSRFLTSGGLPNIDGYNRSTAARTDLQLGTDTTDIYVMRNLFVANRMTTVHASTTGSATVTGVAYFGKIGNHINSYGTIPTITAGGGTNPYVWPNSTDNAGIVNIGSGGTANTVTITFATAFTNTPSCVADTSDATITTSSSTPSTLKINGAVGFAAGANLSYLCTGRNQ